MFKVEVMDEYGEEVIDTLSVDTLGDALDFVKAQILDGRSIEQITLTKEIELSIIVDVQVKSY